MKGYLVKSTDIDAMEGIHKTHFLNKNAQRVNKSLGDLTGISDFGFHLIEVEPGKETTEYHVHYFEDECVYVLSGEATVTIGDSQFSVGAGDFIGYRAGGLPHAMINTGTGILRCIVVGQRLAHDVGDYPKKGKRIYRNEGRAWDLVDIDEIEHPDAGRKC
ncbi:cupin domain-containing protein [Parasalinivibrio latis]|uniref:cupin domain-containing protein n=1 Tax=Parasalinivibrio latis TaxID=2952610 RepID=UPI0030E4CEE9